MKRTVFAAWLIAFAGVAVAAPFQNGSFETGGPTSPNCFQFGITAGSTVIPGWVVSVGDVDWDGDCPVGTNTQASDGHYSLDLLGSVSPAKIGGVQQTFDTVPGATYRVTFSLAGNPGPVSGNPPIKPLAVTVAGTTHNYLFDTTGHTSTDMGWLTETFTFVATGTSETINFVSDMTAFAGGFAGAALDNVQITQVTGPVLLGAIQQDSSHVLFVGRVDTAIPLLPPFTSDIGAGTSCSATSLFATGVPFSVDTQGYFVAGPVAGIAPGTFVNITLVAPPLGTTNCLVSSAANDIWPRALPILGDSVSVNDYIDAPGKARWYRFTVTPGQRIQVTLSGLPADYDLAVFKDIGQAFLSQFNGTPDLIKLSAEYAPSVFSPSVFSPSVFSPSVFSPDAYTPSVFSPSVFSPSVFSPSVFSPSVFSPSVFSPSVFSPSVFSPSVFSPSVFSPSVFSPSVFSPSVFSPDEILKAFSSAQTRSLLGVSATAGTGDENVVVDTWNETGDFYVRVVGRSGAYSTAAPFAIGVAKGPTTCTGVTPLAPLTRAAADGANVQTIVVTDSAKVALDAPLAGGTTLRTKLNAFIARPDIGGVLIDVNQDARVASLKAQAASNSTCPYAKNLVAREIKSIIDSYRTNNPLRYVVIAGNDDVIPFFRYPDQSLLGPESGYFPPVLSTSASEASLRRDFVLGQDAYGSNQEISVSTTSFPVPGLAVGRLVESPAEIAGLLDAYTAANGVVVPHKALVTGYDFLADAADAVRTELNAGTGATSDTLIAPNNISPDDPAAWTAADLRQKLLFGPRYDAIFLAGHFSANSALAADFETSVLTTDLAASPADLTNTIVFSAGCHSAYNIVDTDAINGVTLKLDWAQAFAQKRATLVAGTGYQYGDTDFLEYSERIYDNFARQLRAGSPGDRIAVGEALVRAKKDYLARTPDIRGLHTKALLEATVFGLPMLSVNMPGTRFPNPTTAGAIAPVAVATGPAATLGLKTFDLGTGPITTTPHLTTLKNLAGGTLTATWLSGPGNAVVTNPAEPALPLVNINVTPTDASVVLRGVGFRGGNYSDSTVVPLTGSPTTELRGVHVPFVSQVFYPMRLATTNYYDALSGGIGMNLLVTPAQHRALDIGQGTSTLRKFTSLDFRLYYSGSTQDVARSDAPTIVHVNAVPDAGGTGAIVTAQVVGNPAAGIQEVWASYTTPGSGSWVPVDLTQCAGASPPALCGTSPDSSLWIADVPSLPAGSKYVVQAVNGVGLVSLDDNLGAYYTFGAAAAATTTMSFSAAAPSSARFGDTVSITALLTGAGSPLPNEVVVVSVGGGARTGTTGADGTVTVQLPIVATPGAYSLTASFGGDASFLPSAVSTPFDVERAVTSLTASPSGDGATLTAALGGNPQPQPLMQESVQFSVTGPQGAQTVYSITDFTGFATIPPPGLPPGSYSASQAFFAGNATYEPATLAIAQGFGVYQFSGFRPPIDNQPTLNVVKAGQSIPVKFSLGGNRGLAIFDPGYPASKPVDCAGFTSTDAVEETVTAGGSSLQYDAGSDQYTYVWKTNSAWSKTCRMLILNFKDGSQRIADFQFKK
jgi:choice-of-anchor C domain-containing protein